MSRHPSRRGRPHGLIALTTATVVVVGAWAAAAVTAGGERVGEEQAGGACRGAATDLELTTPSDIGTIPLADPQIENAETIVAATMGTGRTPEEASIALATAMQESALLNVPHGDEAGPDSRGLFQQRLQFYDHIDVMDPSAATIAFLEQLDEVPGWRDLPPHEAIQSVQRAAHPELYADWIEPAQEWTDVLWRYTAACAAAATFSPATP